MEQKEWTSTAVLGVIYPKISDRAEGTFHFPYLYVASFSKWISLRFFNMDGDVFEVWCEGDVAEKESFC